MAKSRAGKGSTENVLAVDAETSESIERAAQDALARVRVPRATYRLQFTPAFTFEHARTLVDYLDQLGISDLYASPIFKARPGSTHGYDIFDYGALNPELGGEVGFNALASELEQRNMGLLLDIVPNHMGIGAAGNEWWSDVLENGPSSNYARYFDISWNPVKPELENKVLLPVLEDQYGVTLESGRLRLQYDDGAFFLVYGDYTFPIAPRTYRLILGPTLAFLSGRLPESDENLQELQSILTALTYLPPRTEHDPVKIAERNRERQVIKRRIASLYQSNEPFRDALARTIVELNGEVGKPHTFDRLDELIEAQAYRTAFWRVAAEEINYRRFFDINTMAAIRVELPEVFEDTHRLVLKLAADDKVTGFRVDHPDGLWNPTDYFIKLQAEVLERHIDHRVGPSEAERAALQWVSHATAEAAQRRGQPHPLGGKCWFPFYVVAEKILSADETLPHNWAIYGTTGYDFMNSVNGLFVDSHNEKAFTRIYEQFIGERSRYSQIVHSSKQTIMLTALSSEINSLSHELERIAEKNRHYRDFTLNGLTVAIREVVAALSVYRTYVDAERGVVPARDEQFIRAAAERAKQRNRRMPAALFDFVCNTLLLGTLDDFAPAEHPAIANFVMRFQQVTGPVMAKGVEDTAFYIYNRLASLNEVGGDPARFGCSTDEFHQQNADRYRGWRYSLLATSTHDSKRSEDVRARINVLSEMSAEWRATLSHWRRMNVSKKTAVGGELAPDHNDEYLLYQTLIGAWPSGAKRDDLAPFRDRIEAYMEKATKEAKVHTNWINPNPAYDRAVRDFVRRLLTGRARDSFLTSLMTFAERVAYFGRYNSLSQTLLKLTSPGVPDFYQGTELFDYSLVDPDNRRPVDYALRRSLLLEVVEQARNAGPDLPKYVRHLTEDDRVGKSKLYLIQRVLDFRRHHPELFRDGRYEPLAARGAQAEHVCGFARSLGDQTFIAVAPRLVFGLLRGEERAPLGLGTWSDTWIPEPSGSDTGQWKDILTGLTVPTVPCEDGVPGLRLSQVLSSFPVAVLTPPES